MPSRCPTCARPMRSALFGVADAVAEIAAWMIVGAGSFWILTHLA